MRGTPPLRPRLQALRQRLEEEVGPLKSVNLKQSTSQRIPDETNDKLATDPIISSLIASATPQQDESSSVLIDRFGRKHTYLRISLTERCNLRCTYCMPEDGLPDAAYVMTTEHILQLAQYFSTRGVTKFRLTGGEPTLRRDLVDIVAGLRRYVPTVGMTTNGVALNSTKLHNLVSSGLTHLNLSLDTLDADQFAKITRRPYFSKVWKTLQTAMEMDDVLSVKLNCVIQRNINEDQVEKFVHLLQTYPHLQIRFIEYMPFADNAWSYDQCVPYTELIQRLEQSGIFLRNIPSEDPHDTTKWFQDPTTGGKIGFITSMSQNFCASCNRLRITSDGLLKVCLFDTETATVDLRTAMEQGIPLDQVVGPAVQRKHKALGGHANPVVLGKFSGENRPMTRIGG